MIVYIDDEAVEIFSGATVVDVLRKVDKTTLTEIKSGQKTITDRFDNERELDGELSDGDKLYIH